METTFKTPHREYVLSADPLACNRLGIAEAMAEEMEGNPPPAGSLCLDAGCGIGPLSVFLADQFGCHVKAIDLNPIACRCCRENVRRFGLGDLIEVIESDIGDFVGVSSEDRFDLIATNPPIGTGTNNSLDVAPSEPGETQMTPARFAWMTNEWQSGDGRDFLDFVFPFAANHLAREGVLEIGTCSLSVPDPRHVIERGCFFGLRILSVKERMIQPDRLGVDDFVTSPVSVWHLRMGAAMQRETASRSFA